MAKPKASKHRAAVRAFGRAQAATMDLVWQRWHRPPGWVEDCRLIVVPSEQWKHLVDDVNHYLDEAGVRGAQMAIRFGPMPFDSVFLAPSQPVDELDDGQFLTLGIAVRGGDDIDGDLVVFGTSPESDFFMPLVTNGEGPTDHLVGAQRHASVVNAVFALLDAMPAVWNERGERIDRGTRRALQKRAPDAVVPKQFYPVDVSRSQTWVGDAREVIATGPCWMPAYRHDVRGHLRLLVRTGAGEPEDALVAKLQGRGYTIASDDRGDLPDDLDQALRVRRRQRRPGTWVAVRGVRVRPHIRGPEDRPYVPAAWRVDLAHMLPTVPE